MIHYRAIPNKGILFWIVCAKSSIFLDLDKTKRDCSPAYGAWHGHFRSGNSFVQTYARPSLSHRIRHYYSPEDSQKGHRKTVVHEATCVGLYFRQVPLAMLRSVLWTITSSVASPLIMCLNFVFLPRKLILLEDT